jgi:hypothetical protein
MIGFGEVSPDCNTDQMADGTIGWIEDDALGARLINGAEIVIAPCDRCSAGCRF